MRNLIHFASRDAMDIDGLGPAALEQLSAALRVHSPADLYDITAQELETVSYTHLDVYKRQDMNRINPGSVNTIRVYTVLSDGVSNVVYACIRMGNSDRPVDNINAGGMYSPIDLETGKIACTACDKQRIVYELSLIHI